MPRKVIIDGRTIEFDNDGDVTINLVAGDSVDQQLEDALRRATVKGYKETNEKLYNIRAESLDARMAVCAS